MTLKPPMGAAASMRDSIDTAGPMSRANHRGEKLGVINEMISSESNNTFKLKQTDDCHQERKPSH